jgi:hypothetical protein
LSTGNLIHPYPVVGLSFALGSTSGGDQETTASSSAYIVLYAANEPAAGSGGLAGDIFMGNNLKMGWNQGAAQTLTISGDSDDILNIGTSAQTGALNIGDSASTKTIDIGGVTNSGTDTINIGTQSTAADVITIGNSNASTTLALTGGDDWSVSTAGLAVLGATANSFTFNPASGPAYAGTARPAKKITLSPEYPGAVLTAYYGSGTDTNITGNMTSDTDTTQGTTIRNYYQWERTTDATEHFYTVAVRVTLPADFSAWATSNALQVNYITESATSTNSEIDVYVYNENSATIVASSTDNASTSWTTVTIDDSTLDDGAGSEWDAAGETVVIYIRAGSASSNFVHIGDIVLNYLAAF